jgi:hypothetical protein
MEYEVDKSLALISSCLEETKVNLQNGDASASDSLLTCLRVARMFFKEERLEPLVRELLGYSEQEAATAMQFFRTVDPEHDEQLWPSGAPAHRLIRGYRVPIFVALDQLSRQAKVEVGSDVIFCDMSASELEAVVERAERDKAPYLVMGFDEETHTVIIIKTQSVICVLNSVAMRVCTLIDELLLDLSQASSEATDGQSARAA